LVWGVESTSVATEVRLVSEKWEDVETIKRGSLGLVRPLLRGLGGLRYFSGVREIDYLASDPGEVLLIGFLNNKE